MSRERPAAKRRLPFERRILLRALLVALPGVLVALILLWIGDYTAKLRWTAAQARPRMRVALMNRVTAASMASVGVIQSAGI